MIIEIDQSGKVEQTGKDTVVAFADQKGFKRSIKISAREKRKLQKFFRKMGKPRFYTHKVFAVLVYLLLKSNISKFDRIIIDPEYPGYEDLLTNLIAELLKVSYKRFELDRIVFKRVGKHSKAHVVANGVFRGEEKPTVLITAEEVLKIIAK